MSNANNTNFTNRTNPQNNRSKKKNRQNNYTQKNQQTQQTLQDSSGSDVVTESQKWEFYDKIVNAMEELGEQEDQKDQAQLSSSDKEEPSDKSDDEEEPKIDSSNAAVVAMKQLGVRVAFFKNVVLPRMKNFETSKGIKERKDLFEAAMWELVEEKVHEDKKDEVLELFTWRREWSYMVDKYSWERLLRFAKNEERLQLLSGKFLNFCDSLPAERIDAAMPWEVAKKRKRKMSKKSYDKKVFKRSYYNRKKTRSGNSNHDKTKNTPNKNN